MSDCGLRPYPTYIRATLAKQLTEEDCQNEKNGADGHKDFTARILGLS